ncbi:Uncharacterised protein [Enterobacter cloacae]|nr:Uncharacterised protein [Enterobacter cloacae]
MPEPAAPPARRGPYRDDGNHPNLHRVRRLADRFMPDGLPMATYCHDILRVESFLLHQGQYRLSKQRPQTHIQLAQLGKRQLLSLADVQDLFF